MGSEPRGMFTALYEADSLAPVPAKPVKVRSNKPMPSPEPVPEVSEPIPPAPVEEPLRTELEDLSLVGYNAHSYRFTSAEIRWLRRFSNKAADTLDRPISHNTMVRVLFRLADDEWNKDPKANRLIKLLSKLPVKS